MLLDVVVCKYMLSYCLSVPLLSPRAHRYLVTLEREKQKCACPTPKLPEYNPAKYLSRTMIIRDFIYNLTNTDTPLHLAGPAKSHLGGVLFLNHLLVLYVLSSHFIYTVLRYSDYS